MSLPTLPKVQKLQEALHAKAKRSPDFRFDEREVETEHDMRLLRHARGNPNTELCRNLPHRATSRLHRTDSKCEA